MKTKLLTLLLIAALFACKKDDDDQTPIEQLPAATQVGANTAGCLVNGQVFLPKGSSQFGPILSCFYQQDVDGYHLGLSFSERTSGNLIKTIQIATNPMQLNENEVYELTSRTDNGSNYNSNFGEYYILTFDGNMNYLTTETYIGELKITKLDTQQRIISGTFWYDAINPNGDIVEVREGRFDMRYVN